MRKFALIILVTIFSTLPIHANDTSCDMNAINAALKEMNARVTTSDADGEAYLKQAVDRLSAKKGWKKRERDIYLVGLLAIPEVKTIQETRNSIGVAYMDALSRGAKTDLCGTMKRSLPMLNKTIELSQKQWAIIRTRVESDLSADNAPNTSIKHGEP
ncbi:MAG: hypothetical protein ABUL58_00795 [Steroidobacter sp.]